MSGNHPQRSVNMDVDPEFISHWGQMLSEALTQQDAQQGDLVFG